MESFPRKQILCLSVIYPPVLIAARGHLFMGTTSSPGQKQYIKQMLGTGDTDMALMVLL